jgi:hypothetical protein
MDFLPHLGQSAPCVKSERVGRLFGRPGERYPVAELLAEVRAPTAVVYAAADTIVPWVYDLAWVTLLVTLAAFRCRSTHFIGARPHGRTPVDLRSERWRTEADRPHVVEGLVRAARVRVQMLLRLLSGAGPSMPSELALHAAEMPHLA